VDFAGKNRYIVASLLGSVMALLAAWAFITSTDLSIAASIAWLSIFVSGLVVTLANSRAYFLELDSIFFYLLAANTWLSFSVAFLASVVSGVDLGCPLFAMVVSASVVQFFSYKERVAYRSSDDGDTSAGILD